MIEQTLILMKPDGVKRGLTGEVLSRFEKVGIKIIAMKMVWVDADFAKKHYKEHVDKAFYGALETLITEGPVVAAVLEGVEVVEVVRKMCGDTEPKKAAPGTIRGDMAHHSYALADSKGIAVKNVIHASGSKPEAKDEVSLWFTSEEIHSYKRSDEVEHLGE